MCSAGVEHGGLNRMKNPYGSDCWSPMTAVERTVSRGVVIIDDRNYSMRLTVKTKWHYGNEQCTGSHPSHAEKSRAPDAPQSNGQSVK